MAKSLKAVIDTNIFVSALLRSKSCIEIIEAFERGDFIVVLSEPILKEICCTLTDKALGISIEDTNRLLKTIQSHMEMATPTMTVQLCRDPHDNKIIEAALAAKADMIVTGDKDLLTLKKIQNIPIVPPKEFVKSFIK